MADMATGIRPVVGLKNVSKYFDGVRALCNVDLAITAGTVHALVGENGAGKSTLGKMIAGIHRPDGGTVLVDGVEVSLDSPNDALRLGITMVAQELALVGPRSVIENVFLGSEAHSGPFVRTRRLRELFEQLVAETGISLPPDAIVDELSIADQQKVEILRAIARRSRVIVMDEPTARLATHESRALRGIVKKLRDAGTTIIYVSHFLEEVLEISDDITVLRDGRWVETSRAADEDERSLVAKMIGRSLEAQFPKKNLTVPDAPLALKLSGLSGDGFSDVDLEVRQGEIVALTGLVGSGRSEVLRAIFGAGRIDSGSMEVYGAKFTPSDPAGSLRRRLSLIPESRKSEGLFLDFSISENVSLSSLSRFRRFGVIDRARERAAVTELAAELNIKFLSVSDAVGLLSGGNQQKVMFAKALLSDPQLLLVDEPTRGVDVGAKRQIYDLLTGLASQGMAILMVSSEMEEVVGLAHRVFVMRQGRVTGQLASEEIVEERVAALAFGQSEPRHSNFSEGDTLA